VHRRILRRRPQERGKRKISGPLNINPNHLQNVRAQIKDAPVATEPVAIAIGQTTKKIVARTIKAVVGHAVANK